MSLTAREWLLLPKQEQQRRGKELSSEECFKLRMDLSEIHFTEEEKMKMTDEEKEHFIHQQQLSEEEKEKNARSSFDVMKQFGILPQEATYDEWKKRGRPLNWK